MSAIYPAKYYDEWGEQTTVIENDGRFLSTLIYGVRFEGADFDQLEPQGAISSSNPRLFTLASGALCNCVLEFEMPILVMALNKDVVGTLYVHLKLGKPRSDGGIDEETLQLKLQWDSYGFLSSGKTGWFADELSDLQSALPHGFKLKCCFSCALSLYHPAGFGLFGGLACFRDNKEKVLNVQSKSDLFRIWDSMTAFVQETYLCPEFQTRI